MRMIKLFHWLFSIIIFLLLSGCNTLPSLPSGFFNKNSDTTQTQTLKASYDPSTGCVIKPAKLEQDQAKTTSEGMIGGAIVGGLLGILTADNTEDRIKNAIAGGLVGGIIGTIFGHEVAKEKERHYLTEQEIAEETCFIQRDIQLLQQANAKINADIRQYQQKRQILLAKKHQGTATQAELTSYRKELVARQEKEKNQLNNLQAKLDKRIKLEKELYQKHRNHSGNHSPHWENKIAELEKEKRILENNVDNLLALSASI